MSGSEMTKAVVHRWRDGDEAAAEEIYLRYADRMWSPARTQIGQRPGRRSDADDVVQSVFRTFFRRHVATSSPSTSPWPSGSCCEITINKVRRKAKFHKAAIREIAREVHAPDDEMLPEILADLPKAESAFLDDRLTRLKREVEIVQLYLEGFSTGEIAARVGRSRATVRRLLNRVGGLLEERLCQDSRDWGDIVSAR